MVIGYKFGYGVLGASMGTLLFGNRKVYAIKRWSMGWTSDGKC